MKITPGFRVTIDAEALERIWHWTDLAKGEFSCLACVTDDVLVHDVQLFEQTCTQASTDIDQQALAQFLCQHPQPEKVRAWIHSHASMQVFWSQQDDACIEGLQSETFLVSIVVNKRREMKCRLDLWHPVRLTLDDIHVEVRVPRYNLKAECAAAFRELVTEVQPALLPQWPPLGKPLQRVVQGWPDWDDDDLPQWRNP
jgi:hypothetical protein